MSCYMTDHRTALQYVCILQLQLSCNTHSTESVLTVGYLTDHVLIHYLASVFSVSDSPLLLCILKCRHIFWDKSPFAF